jgi:pimeloyl-ACP methyl ester carboxylesterase
MTGAPYTDLVAEDLRFDHPDWGGIYVRNKRPAGCDQFTADRVVVLQHGATYGSAAFDLPFGGISFMDYLAGRGFDAYCLDLPGYGNSDLPPQMSEPAEQNPPFMRTPDAANCLGFICDQIRERRDIDRLCLIGWSWGTAITSYYTASHNDLVERLTLYAPVWDRTQSGPSPIHVAGKIGAYRTVTRDATLARRQGGLTEEQKKTVMPLEWFDQWWDATAASVPDGSGKTVRAPNGVVQDGAEYWNVGKALYDPAQIRVPVLVVVGELDNDTPCYMAQTVFPLFTNAPWKRLSILSGGTHAIMMESNRMLLFRTVMQFMEEAAPGPDVLS